MHKIRVNDAISLALQEEMERDPKIFIIGEEVGKSGGTYKCTKDLYAKFPNRIIDTPISEMGFTGMACGASYSGLIPVCEFMTWNFAFQSIDHIINSSAKMRYMSGNVIKNNSIVFRGPNGLSKGVGAQHTHDLSALLGSIPGLFVAAPFSARDHRGILKKALRCGNPVAILENEELYKNEFICDESFNNRDFQQEFCCVKERSGNDITIVGISLNLMECLGAADDLYAIHGIEAEVINLLSIRPLDMEAIYESVQKTKKLIVVDNFWPMFGLASEIACNVFEKFIKSNCKMIIKRLSGTDCPTPYSEKLEKLAFISQQQIVANALEIIKPKD
ncbi:hypothetical protein EDEG_00762 [Edhazardia aedis USNM 41457]|uniref:Pyruvate dehydrogenase E1 component subunit beta n=1 Tax=Edhazardia aedis (strain USNM 41457) TaxID=1003232 RepID=J9DBQ0_EDHAE|nr:hypothetical protein EDEG_00762 [Edhazardia aedis USNM 41457]|eukprot:EJW05151.1 hypothetical protein EDEG_00762 [Edhazardia aedis USNM 41457]